MMMMNQSLKRMLDQIGPVLYPWGPAKKEKQTKTTLHMEDKCQKIENFSGKNNRGEQVRRQFCFPRFSKKHKATVTKTY